MKIFSMLFFFKSDEFKTKILIETFLMKSMIKHQSKYFSCQRHSIRRKLSLKFLKKNFHFLTDFPPSKSVTVGLTPLSSSWISWRDFPLVSGKIKTAKRTASTLHALKIQKAVCVPKRASMLLKNFVIIKARPQHTKTVIPEAFALTSDANISPITDHGSGPHPIL